MNGLTDLQLLREYAEHRVEAAFGELVRRHIDLVYSAAFRMVRDTHLAEDVTQGVFLALSQCSDKLVHLPVLSGWLYRTTQNLSANVVRTEVRRRERERKAVVMNELLSEETAPRWQEMEPELDSAMGELSESDRDALLLRYFERKTAREMAERLGTSEEAAQKRVNRALDRLGEVLAQRGVEVGAGGLAVLISANAVQAAPTGLALSVTAAALSGTALVSTITAGKTIAMTALQKTLFTAALAAAIGVSLYEARQTSNLRAQVDLLTQRQGLSPAPPPEPAVASLENKVEGLEVQKTELEAALTRANAEKARLTNEREQARRSADLYKDLVEQPNSKETNPTNRFPSSRHVWAAFGRMGRLEALSKEDDSQRSVEEKAALDAAKTKALEELPTLIKAAKEFETGKELNPQSEQLIDEVACLLYGALNLDEQQFGQVYGVMEKIQQEAKLKGLSKDMPPAEATQALRQVMDQFKTDAQSILTPEQSRIFADVISHFALEPGNFTFNFKF